MADYNPSIALDARAPDPQQGLNTLSKIMGLGSQGLAIRGQQSQNVSLAAAATEAQQNAKEKMAGAKLLSDPVANGLVDANGNPTKDAQKIIYQAMPTTGSQHYEGLLSGATAKVKFNGAVNSLRTAERGEISDAIGGAAAGAQSPDEVTAAIDNLVASKKGTPEEENYTTIANTAKHAINHLADKTKGDTPPEAGKEPWRQGALNIARSVLPASATVGEGGIGTPTRTVMQTATGQQPGTVAPALQGAGFTPTGREISAPPTITTNATGQLVRVAPGGIGASVVPTAPQPGQSGQPTQNANPTQAEAIGQRGQAEAVSQRIGQVQAQAATTVQAQDALSRAKAILESPEAPNTGAGYERVKGLKNVMSSLGIDTQGANDMNSLAKNLARYEASRATASGLGHTDAARELAHNGSPNTQLDNKALLGIVRQSLATEKVLAGYANVQSKTNDPQQQLKNEAAFRAIPHPIETAEYLMSRNKAEAEEYLKEHGLTHPDIAKSAAALKQFGAL